MTEDSVPSGEVFISYSWDSPDHTKRIAALSNRLRVDGFDCVLDQYEVSPPEGWPRWMDRKIREAHLVLVICTELYYRRSIGEEDAGTGLGVRWEGSLIFQHLYDAGATNTRFVPVLFDRSDKQYIPTPLRGASYSIVDTEEGYASLKGRLECKPPVDRPSVGKRKPQPKKEVQTDISLYASMPINVPVWDEAHWRGTAFLIAPDGPPALALLFKNERPAKKIFEEWHERYGNSDEFEELRVSIIEGKVAGEPPGYTVHVGLDFESCSRRYKAKGLELRSHVWMLNSRLNRMATSSTAHLEKFKEAYRRFKTYFLLPGLLLDGNNAKPIPELGIYKNSIHFRHVSDIGENDFDYLVLRTGGVPRALTEFGKKLAAE